MSDERQKSRPCGRRCISDLQGSRTSGAGHLSGVGLDVTVLAEHQDLADVYSDCVTGRAWTSEATVAPVIGRPSAVQATVVHAATVGQRPALYTRRRASLWFQEEAKSPTSHLIAR